MSRLFVSSNALEDLVSDALEDLNIQPDAIDTPVASKIETVIIETVILAGKLAVSTGAVLYYGHQGDQPVFWVIQNGAGRRVAIQ